MESISSMSTPLSNDFFKDADAIHKHAMRTLFERLDSLYEGAIMIDQQGKIAWINGKYLSMLKLGNAQHVLGKDVETIIPNSMLREVMRSGQPILLDIMEFGQQSFVVTRMPVENTEHEVIGAVGFVLYEQVNALKPLVAKFAALQTELAAAKQGLAENRRAKYTLLNFVGDAPACMEVKHQARRAAQQNASILLLGETGTGKEILANAIHAMSLRAAGPFIGINMAAVPDALLESEFFGVAPGAFTGADKKTRDGKFKLADHGTLFLDEIGDMPLPMQGKLLRVLQEQEIELLGSNKVVKVDVRVIAATSVDLALLVKQGRFRSDLYYRLNVLPIKLPPLRDRLSDMDVLCDALLQQIFEQSGMPRREISAAASALLASYQWPGNIRELRNVLERACILSDNFTLGTADFAMILPAPEKAPATSVAPVRSYAEALAEFDRNIIKGALDAAGGNVPAAAKLLGLSRATLYKRIAAPGHVPPQA
jgi:transcriptional regulator with PAS, ATPase and Fis domain